MNNDIVFAPGIVFRRLVLVPRPTERRALDAIEERAETSPKAPSEGAHQG